MSPLPRAHVAGLADGTLIAAVAIFCGVAAGLSLKMLVITPPSQALVERSALAALAVLAFLVLFGRERLMRPVSMAMLLRAGLDAVAALTFALAVFELPLALLTALHLTLPIMSTLLAVLLLNERIGRMRWCALALGFAGVLVILQPSLAASALGLALIMISTISYALRDIVTARLPPSADSAKGALLAILLIGVAAALVPADRPWTADQGGEWVWVACSAVFFLGANLLILSALRRTEIRRIAPLRYTSILWAILFDWLFFGVHPNAPTLVGVAMIVGAGILLMVQSPLAGTAAMRLACNEKPDARRKSRDGG